MTASGKGTLSTKCEAQEKNGATIFMIDGLMIVEA